MVRVVSLHCKDLTDFLCLSFPSPSTPIGLCSHDPLLSQETGVGLEGIGLLISHTTSPSSIPGHPPVPPCPAHSPFQHSWASPSPHPAAGAVPGAQQELAEGADAHPIRAADWQGPGLPGGHQLCAQVRAGASRGSEGLCLQLAGAGPRPDVCPWRCCPTGGARWGKGQYFLL